MLNLGCQHPKVFGKKDSKILKLLSVRNCFTLAMTYKLVVIINSLKLSKIKKILLYEMKFLVLNYSCLQNPWLWGYCPQIPVLSVLSPQLNLLNPPQKQNSWVCHWWNLYCGTIYKHQAQQWIIRWIYHSKVWICHFGIFQ